MSHTTGERKPTPAKRAIDRYFTDDHSDDEMDTGIGHVHITRDFLEQGVNDLLSEETAFDYNADVVFSVCQLVRDVLRGEDNIVYLDIPLFVVGDIHAKLSDLIAVVRKGGDVRDSNVRYLFLGDYVDRGGEDIKVLMLLFFYETFSAG
eukprot:TRINITY_DN1084_c0_g1_i1.p2 TRINITY_DN1084_c0_g1~~TRINITY_DN1084_c0_g1_i1.p2  ORF type:complete len:149 (+),score=35.88 TRINITY_DN1084_c0_g1_i1:432-878(+)